MACAPATIKVKDYQGGVAALAKRFIDCWCDPQDQVQWPGRACVGHARLPGMGVVALCSVYLE
eukprot:5827836-Pyramimonas_sp.AAC.1